MIRMTPRRRAIRLNDSMVSIRSDVAYGRAEFWFYEAECPFNDVIKLSRRADRLCREIEFLRRQLGPQVRPVDEENFVAVARPIVERAIALWHRIAKSCDDHGIGGADRARGIAAKLSAALRDTLSPESEANA